MPTPYPCGVCSKAVRWNQKGIACDSCNIWYHTRCIDMKDSTYDRKSQSVNSSWYCLKCGAPSFSSTLFQPPNAHSFNISNPNSLNISTETQTSDDTILGTPQILSSTPVSTIPIATLHLDQSPITSHFEDSSTSTFLFPEPVDNRTKLRSLVVNFQSARKKDIRIRNLIATTQPHIIFGSETWLIPNINSSELFPKDYVVYRKDRDDGFGGVLLAIHNSLVSSEIETKSKTETIFVKIETKNNHPPLILGAFYRPPKETSTSYPEDFFSCVASIMKSHHSSPIWIGGDFNLPDIDWDNLAIVGHRYPTDMSKAFLEHIQALCLQQSVSTSTRGRNTLDIFLSNTPDLIENSTIIPGLSDHDIPLIDSRISALISKIPRRKIYLWDRADKEAIKADSRNFNLEFCSKYTIDNNPGSETLYSEICKHLQLCQEKHVPSKITTNKRTTPHTNKELRSLSRRKNRAWKKAKKSNKDEDWANYRLIRKLTSKCSRKAKAHFIHNATSGDDKNKMWKYIKSLRTSSSGIPPLYKSGLTFAAPSAKSKILNDQFCSAFTPPSINPPPPNTHISGPTIHDIKISIPGVEKLLRTLKPKKATGPDNIPSQLLSLTSQELAPSITLLFQVSLNTGVVPSIWRHALVSPIFKKGDKKLPNNYRPISLTCHLCKLLEHIIRRSIADHLENNNLLSNVQYGFRKGKSCETQLVQVTHDLAKSIEANSQTDVILLDFEKAFDKVSHPHLLHKLHQIGIQGKILTWIKNFLADRTQCVVVEGCHSDSGRVTSGVPQGSVLGPTLFLVYINDITSSIKSPIRLFADDTVLYRRVNSAQDAEILQQDLDKLQIWEETWQMKFNVNKCEHLRVTLKKKPLKTSFSLHNQTLHQVNSAKYLGLTISHNLSWQNHIDITSAKASKTSAFIMRNLKGALRSSKTTAYTSMVRPILEYAAPVWDPIYQTQINQLEAIQRRASRQIFCNYDKGTSPTELLDKLKLPSLQTRRNASKVTLFHKFVYKSINSCPPDHTLVPKSSAHHTRGNIQQFQHLQCRTDRFKQTFFPSAIKLWNSLPNSLVQESCIEQFKHSISLFPH